MIPFCNASGAVVGQGVPHTILDECNGVVTTVVRYLDTTGALLGTTLPTGWSVCGGGCPQRVVSQMCLTISGVTREIELIKTIDPAGAITVAAYELNGTLITPFPSLSELSLCNGTSGVSSVAGIPVINVKDFGALGNGVADDTASIAAAIATAGIGSIVYYPAGTYLTGMQTLNTGVRHVGAGYEGTILKLKNSANSAIFQGANWATLTGTNSSGGVHSWAVTDMSLDGNKANNTSGHGIRVYGYGFELARLRAHDFDNNGITSEWGLTLGFISPADMMATVTDVQSHHNSGDGVDWSGPHDSVFTNCYAYNCGGFGFKVTELANTSGAGTAFTNCHSYGVGQTWAYYLSASGVILDSCIAEGAGINATTGGQILVRANDVTINGCLIYSAGVGSPAGNVRGIVIGDGSTVAGTKIDAKVNNCIAGSIVFVNDGGSMISVQAYATSGALYSGTVNAATAIFGTVAGGHTHAGNILPGKLKIGQLAIPTGANCTMGTATLVAGKCQIFTDKITATSLIFLTPTVPGGTTGVLCARNIGGTDRSAGAWFFVSSMTTAGALQSADTSTFNWLLIEPS